MDTCPFCHSEVSDDLVRLGGTCPNCLAHIPGEEAPTDPGAAELAAQEAADRKALRQTRWVVEGLAGVALLALIGLAAWMVLRPKPVAKVLDFDDVAYKMDDTQFVAYVEPPPDPAPAPAPPTVHHPARKHSLEDLKVPTAAGDVDVGKAVSAQPARPAPEQVGTRGPTEGTDAVADVDGATQSAASGTRAGGIQFGIDIGVDRRPTKGIRLTDDDAIIEMIKEVLLSHLPRLKSCYEQRLKVDETLRGRWTLSLVVSREGDPKNIRVKGDGVSDPQMERCIAAKVAKWEFQPIRADQPIQKSLTFRPGL